MLRNFLFEKGLLSSKEHEVKTISIGNLSVGGTGKSPMTHYLMKLLAENSKVAILSRGYGRSSKGFKIVNVTSTSVEVGDEPLMFKTAAKDHVQVAVCENRNDGISGILYNDPKTEIILLDDAFQHRKTKVGLSILLTTFEKPFFNDYVLPMGTLRERRKGAKRADIIVITKCPRGLKDVEKDSYREKLAKFQKPVFFASISYGEFVGFTQKIGGFKNILLVTGIANPKGLVSFLSESFYVDYCLFSDHHEFNLDDIEKIHRKFDTFAQSEKVIVTTFKDYMRLKDKKENWGLNQYPWFYLPISVKIDREDEFNSLITNYVRTN